MTRKKKRATRRLYLKWAIVALIAAAALFYVADIYQKYMALTPTRIGIIRVSGSIENFDKYMDQAYAARDDPSIKAVVVVVDSPGGTAQACFQTEAAFRELNSKKPVVVTMGQYAASGAYLVSTASDYIFAHEYTITAGLGVVAIWISYENKFEEEGIHYYVWKSGESKDLGAEYRPPTEEENAYMQSLVDNYMEHMITCIEHNRPQVENTIDGFSDGITVYGIDALDHNLVDRIGDYQDARCKAAELAGLEEGTYTIVELGS